MWSPAPAPQPFSWALVQASYPYAYRALFETGGGLRLSTALGGPDPVWFSTVLSEAQLLARRYDDDWLQGRPFEFSDLIAFFGAYQYVFSVRGLRTSALGTLPATWRYGYTVRTPTALVGRSHPDGPYPFASHAIAQQAAFLMGFSVLDTQLRS